MFYRPFDRSIAYELLMSFWMFSLGAPDDSAVIDLKGL